MTREEREKAIEIIRKYECNAEHYEACEAIIKASEQEHVLDKIRAEIENSRDAQSVPYDDECYSFLHGVDRCLGIIDKYRAESEGEE